jgi:hypothetical protein
LYNAAQSGDPRDLNELHGREGVHIWPGGPSPPGQKIQR